VVDQLRADLSRAIKAKDGVAVAALRSVLAAIGNAEAVSGDAVPDDAEQSQTIAGAVVGLRASEVERRRLEASDVAAIVRAEIAERHSAADAIDPTGAHPQAVRLRAEADVLRRYLPGG
jgi:uncharacterized protein